MHILTCMKTTTSTVKLSNGGEWIQFITGEGRSTSWMQASDGSFGEVDAKVAQGSVEVLKESGWSVVR